MAPGDTLQPHLQSRTLTGSCKGCGAWRRRARPAVCRAPRLPSPPTCGHRGPNVWALPGPEAAYCKRQGHASAHGQESVRCVWWRKAYPHPSPQPKHAWPRSRVSACPSWGESAHPSRHWREGSLRAQWAPHPVLGTRPAGLPDSPVSATQLKAEAQRGQVTSKARWLRKGWGWGLGPSGLQAEPHPGPQLTCLLLLLRAMMPRSPRASPVKVAAPALSAPTLPPSRLGAHPQSPSRSSRIRQVPGRTGQSGRPFAQPLQPLGRGAPGSPIWHRPSKEDAGEGRGHAVCLMSVGPGVLEPGPPLFPHCVAGASSSFGVRCFGGGLLRPLLSPLRLGLCCLGVQGAAGQVESASQFYAGSWPRLPPSPPPPTTTTLLESWRPRHRQAGLVVAPV